MILRILAVVVLIVAFSNNVYAQDGSKIVYVNMDKAMKNSVLAKNLSSKFEAEFSKRAKQLKNLEAELRDAKQSAIKKSATMSASQRDELQTSLIKKEREYRFKKTVFDEDAKLATNKLNVNVESAVYKVISELTKQEQYDLVLTNGVLFSSKAVDITDKVIAKLQ